MPKPDTRPPPPSLAAISMQNGAGSIGFGLVLLLGGVVLLFVTMRSPSFDPERGLRAPIDEGTAALDITQAGSYVLYLETAECTAEPVEMRRVGEPSATPGPVDDQRFESYSYDELCGVPVGSYDLRTAGLWTALPTASNGGNAVLYGSDDPPVYVDWDGSWLYFALMAVGAVVLTYGVVQRRRWRAALEAHR
jgi:hypothetical protein